MSFTRDELHLDRERPDYDDYPEFTFPIQDFHVINAKADAIRKAKGLMPMFDFENEHDEDGWYEFTIECMWQDNDISGIELWFIKRDLSKVSFFFRDINNSFSERIGGV